MRKFLLSILFVLIILIPASFPSYAANIQIKIDNVSLPSDVAAEMRQQQRTDF